MLMRQLVGALAGENIEMPYHVAMDCLRAGTAQRPDIEARDITPKVVAETRPMQTLIPPVKRKRGRPRKHPRI